MSMLYTGRPVPSDGRRKFSAREASQRAKALACLRSRGSTECKGQVFVGMFVVSGCFVTLFELLPRLARILVDQRHQIIDIGLQTAGAAIHLLFGGADFEPANVLRVGGRA